MVAGLGARTGCHHLGSSSALAWSAVPATHPNTWLSPIPALPRRHGCLSDQQEPSLSCVSFVLLAIEGGWLEKILTLAGAFPCFAISTSTSAFGFAMKERG